MSKLTYHSNPTTKKTMDIAHFIYAKITCKVIQKSTLQWNWPLCINFLWNGFETNGLGSDGGKSYQIMWKLFWKIEYKFGWRPKRPIWKWKVLWYSNCKYVQCRPKVRTQTLFYTVNCKRPILRVGVGPYGLALLTLLLVNQPYTLPAKHTQKWAFFDV